MLSFEKPIFTEEKAAWERPRTTRRYLHPPRSERMFTLWGEGKIIFGENDKGVDAASYPEIESAGIWLFYSRFVKKFDFRRVKNILPEDGTPIHAIEHNLGGIRMQMEAFCDTERKCTAFIKITVKNPSPFTAANRLALALRTGKEKDLAYGSPDEYLSYDPELSAFLNLPSTFAEKDGVYLAGDTFVTVKTELEQEFDQEKGILWFPLSLEPGEEKEVILSFGKGEQKFFDYSEEKEKTRLFWEKELGKIRETRYQKTIRNLTVQILQSFSYYKGEEDLVLRQGGLQRLMWPWEAMPSLEALKRIGDFDDYIEDALSFYFDKMQQKDGEVKTIGEGWASVTASCLYSLSRFMHQKGDKAYFDRYAEKALRTFDWIKGKRRESETIEGAVKGLFPPMRGSDWQQTLQHWTNTDVFAYFAVRALAEALEIFSHPRKEEVRAESEDYVSRMGEIFSAYAAKWEGDELRVPLTPDGNDAYFLENFYPYLLPGAFCRAVKPSEKEIDRILNHHKRVGLYCNGLHSRMPYRDGTTHIFYTTNGDFHWYYVYLNLGRVKEANKTLAATMKYSMTAEYYMNERYHANDPYYVPWSPNVSASGRVILMLLDFPGEFDENQILS